MEDKSSRSHVLWYSFALSGDKILLWIVWAGTCTLFGIQKSSSLVLVWSGSESTALYRVELLHSRVLTLGLFQPLLCVWAKLTLLISGGIKSYDQMTFKFCVFSIT